MKGTSEIGGKAQHVLFADTQVQQQIMAHPTRLPAATFAGRANQCRRCLADRQVLRENSAIWSVIDLPCHTIPARIFYQLVAQRRQRPLLHLVGHRQSAQEVGEVLGQRVQLQPHGVGGEAVARQPCPVDRVLALFDPLLRRAALIVEGDNPLGAA